LAPPVILKIGVLKDIVQDKAWLVGAGYLKYENEIKEAVGEQGKWIEDPIHDPKAMSLARLAFGMWKSGLRPALETLKPLYLRIPAVDEKKS
jgi:hypothetical protein